MDRSQLGAENIGEPVREVYRTLHALGEQKAWPDINWEPVKYYYDRMVGSWLLQLMDHTLSDAQLGEVEREEVSLIVFLLFRDLFRHHSNLLRPAAADAGWVEPFFQEVARDLRLADEAIRDNGQPYEIEIDDLQNCIWAKSLAAPFGLPAEKLLACHSAIVTGVTEEWGRHRIAAADDGTRVPAFSVYRVTFGGLIPLARYYNCTRCEHDLADWVMKQSPSEPSTCPNCEVRIDEREIARAQRDTKLGCLWTLVSIAGLVLVSAVIVGVVWLLTDPGLLNRFR